MKELLTEREYKKIFLKETQRFPQFLVPLFKSTAENLNNAISSLISEELESGSLAYYPPKNDYAKCIIFIIELFKTNDISNVQQYHAGYIGRYLNLNEEKFDYVTIKIKCPYKEKDFGKPFINAIVYHELEHMYDDYMRQKNHGIAMTDDFNAHQILEFTKYIKNNYSNNLFLYTIKNIIYLGDINEIKAFSVQAYKELEDINCTRENYLKDIENITSYKTYKYVKEKQLPLIKTANDEDLNLLISIYQKFPRLMLPKKQPKETLEKYREKLYKWSDHKLHVFMKRFGGVLSLYLQNKIQGKP